MTAIVESGVEDLSRDEVVETWAELVPICNEMLALGLPKRLAITAMVQAVKYEGLRHLLTMWHQEENLAVRDEVVADIAEVLEDLEIAGGLERPAIRHEDVAPLIVDVRAFKDTLRRVVDARGGISWLADQSKIPQPSLSRFFNTGSVPQRGTLLKLREALAPEGDALIEGWLSR